MICPIDLPNIRDRILHHVGPQHVRRLRLVSHTWNKSAVGALASCNNCRIRVTPENIDEYVSSRLLRGVARGHDARTLRPGLKMHIDFGRVTTCAQFQHLIDVVTNKLCAGAVDAAGAGRPDHVDKITFHGADASFAVGPPEWVELLQLLQLTAPELGSLDLFDRNWTVAEDTFLHWKHFRGDGKLKLAFPSLQELAYCWQEPTTYLLEALLLPGVAPALTKVQLTVQDVNVDSYESSLIRSLESLQQCSGLTELTLGVDLQTSAFFQYTHIELRTVRRLCLHIFKNGLLFLFGEFLSRMFPEITSLDLWYDSAEVGPDSEPSFPCEIGSLPRLEALGYGWIASGSGSTLLITDLQPGNDFPALRSVATDPGFELSNRLPRARLEFLTVNRLNLRLLATTSLTEDELQQHAVKLHGMYPNVTCLAFDLKGSNPNSKPSTVRSIEILVLEFRGFEELEFLGCDVQVGELLQALIDDEGAGAAIRFVRRLKVKLGTDAARIAAETVRMTALKSVRMTLGNFPHLEHAEVDETFVVGSSVKAQEPQTSA